AMDWRGANDLLPGGSAIGGHSENTSGANARQSSKARNGRGRAFKLVPIVAQFVESLALRDVTKCFSFNHHRSVAALPPEKADLLLDWCEQLLKEGTGKARPIKALREEMGQRGFRRS